MIPTYKQIRAVVKIMVFGQCQIRYQPTRCNSGKFLDFVKLSSLLFNVETTMPSLQSCF